MEIGARSCSTSARACFAIRAELGLSEGSTLSLRLQDGEIRLFDRALALRRAQQIAAQYKKPGESVVAELIQERRQAAAQE